MKTDYTPGKHILLDIWGCKGLDDIKLIEKALMEAANVCGAHVLDIKLHGFGEGAGITGVAILAESHMSIHTWPENEYAALDIFMCGSCDAEKALLVFEKIFSPARKQVKIYSRGKTDNA